MGMSHHRFPLLRCKIYIESPMREREIANLDGYGRI
jgi:hypothetical protein